MLRVPAEEDMGGNGEEFRTLDVLGASRPPLLQPRVSSATALCRVVSVFRADPVTWVPAKFFP